MFESKGMEHLFSISLNARELMERFPERGLFHTFWKFCLMLFDWYNPGLPKRTLFHACGRALLILPHALALEVTFPCKLCSNGKKLHTLLHKVLLMTAYTPRAQNDKVYKGI